jgi:hypothetical protein
MGSLIELNDTLRISKEQGFPAELDIEKHLPDPYTFADVEGKVYEFKAKEKIRLNTPEEMREHFEITHFLSPEQDYFRGRL